MLYQIIIATVIGGILSLIGGIVLLWHEQFAKRASLYLISFAAGSLLGAAFFEILPEAIEGVGEGALAFVVFGILIIFIFEKFLGWYHHHDHRHDDAFESHTFSAQTVLFGDALHNFIDGIAIALGFLVSVEVGIATTLAVFVHEIPQEIGDFGVLIKRGYERKKIILYNFLTSLTALVGALATFFFLPLFPTNFIFYALATAAGTFVYISTSDLIPELRESSNGGLDLGHTFALLLGLFAVIFVSTIITA